MLRFMLDEGIDEIESSNDTKNVVDLYEFLKFYIRWKISLLDISNQRIFAKFNVDDFATIKIIVEGKVQRSEQGFQIKKVCFLNGLVDMPAMSQLDQPKSYTLFYFNSLPRQRTFSGIRFPSVGQVSLASYKGTTPH